MSKAIMRAMLALTGRCMRCDGAGKVRQRGYYVHRVVRCQVCA